MRDSHPIQFVWSNAVRALVLHEWRSLRQNWMACTVLVLILLVAAMLRLAGDQPASERGPVCYVVYWDKNDWVGRLEEAAQIEADRNGLQIEVVPVAELTDPDGVIRYPPGSHSIQLRPIDPTKQGRAGWLIWYWYSGNDAAALLPYLLWFQQVTHTHFSDGIQWYARTSPMRLEVVLLGAHTRINVEALVNPDRIRIALIWLTLFFVACHLSKLSLVESLCNRTFHSLVVTPVGWKGLAMANRLFYGLLTLALATTATTILDPSLLSSVRYWLTVVCATAIYLGVSLAIASRCSSVASAAVATTVYLFISGLLFGTAMVLPAPWATVLSESICPDAAIVSSLSGVWTTTEQQTGTVGLVAMLIWAVVWQIGGELSYHRLRKA